MINTKQFTIFFLLVVVFLVAIMIVTSLAWRESTTTYDTTSIRATLLRIVNISAVKIQAQEDAMNHWVHEVDQELLDAENQINFFMNTTNTTIYPVPAPVTP
jgi:hypothetical protein